MKNQLIIAALLCGAAPAWAQTFEATGQIFATPLGMESNADMETPISPFSDEQFNRTALTWGEQPFGQTSVGNLITVVTHGSNNSIQINANQNNSGNQIVTINGP